MRFVNFLPRAQAPRMVHLSGDGYDLVADYYDNWSWQEFWRTNEFPIVLAALRKASPRKALLDLGVGTGAFLGYAMPHLTNGLRLVGVDVSAEMLRHAHLRLGLRAELLQSDIQRALPFEDGTFDAIVMMRVANHLRDLTSTITEAARLLSPGGVLVATDLADEYEYLFTRIPTPDSKVSIETYKHSEKEWRDALKESFDNTEITEFSLSNLKKFGASIGSKSILDDTPIFKVIVSEKSQ